MACDLLARLRRTLCGLGMNYRSSLLFALAAAVLLLGGGCGGAHKTVLHGGVGPSELLVKQIVVPGGPIPIEGARTRTFESRIPAATRSSTDACRATEEPRSAWPKART